MTASSTSRRRRSACEADVLADKDPSFTRSNFCSVIRALPGEGKPRRILQAKIQALRLFESIGQTGPADGDARSLAH